MSAKFATALLSLVRKITYRFQKTLDAFNTALQAFPSGYTYKGTLASAQSLPPSGDLGDLYVITDESNAQYVWNGTQWQNLTKYISEQQIDSLYR